MKKILFATLLFLGVTVVSNAKPAAKTTIHKREATRPKSTVRPVSSTTTATSLPKAATDKVTKKHKKHKKHHNTTPKKTSNK